MNHWTWRKITQSPVFNLTNRKHLKNENNSSDLGVYAKPLDRPSTFSHFSMIYQMQARASKVTVILMILN